MRGHVTRRRVLIVSGIAVLVALNVLFVPGILFSSPQAPSDDRSGVALPRTVPQTAPACAPAREARDRGARLRMVRALSVQDSARCLSLDLEAGEELWITGKLAFWGTYIAPQFSFTIRALVEQHGFAVIDYAQLLLQVRGAQLRNESVGQELRALSPSGKLPAAVVVWEMYDAPDVFGAIRALAPLFFFMDDAHYFHDKQRLEKRSVYENVDVVFSTYAYVFRRFHPGFDALPVKWTPHAASPDFRFRDVNESAARTVLLSGAIGDYYPLRKMARAYAERDERVALLPHPGYDVVTGERAAHIVIGRAYANMLRQHRAAITCGSTLQYVVAKMLEIPSTGTLLLVGDTVRPQLMYLGLLDGVHYVSFAGNESSLKAAVDRVTSDNHDTESELHAIRHAAQYRVNELHTTEARAKQIARNVRLWAAAWHAKRRVLRDSHAHADARAHREAKCYDAFVSDATQPSESHVEPLDPRPPSDETMRQVEQLVGSFYGEA